MPDYINYKANQPHKTNPSKKPLSLSLHVSVVHVVLNRDRDLDIVYMSGGYDLMKRNGKVQRKKEREESAFRNSSGCGVGARTVLFNLI